ncbi:MAG: ribbon-helix-helix domain-containing protein [Halanaerobiales bacterium]|nr:ribbon-helix-helix domain-containing protein [Halanaerobiales bacterium]
MSKKRFTTYVTEEAYEKIKKLSDDTRVPIAQYMQEAIEDLLEKYDRLSE